MTHSSSYKSNNIIKNKSYSPVPIGYCRNFNLEIETKICQFMIMYFVSSKCYEKLVLSMKGKS